MNRIANYHSHVALCGHAEGNVEDYIKEAIRNNYVEVGISDHAPIPKDWMSSDLYEYLWLSQMMTLDIFYNQYLKELNYCINKYPNISILKGLEIEFLPNHDDYYKMLLKDLDYFNLGIHYFISQNHIISTYDGISEINMIDYAYTVEEALKTGFFTTLVHPDLYLIRVKEFTKFHENIARKIIESCLKYDVYLEVNANGKGRYPRKEFWEIVKEYKDCKIIIGSDAHHIYDFHGKQVAEAIKFASQLELNVQERMIPKKCLLK